MSQNAPETQAPTTAAEVFAGGGQMGALMRAIDWSRTELGPVERWPAALRTMVGVVLGSRFPMLVWWGEHLVQLYNDSYRPILGDKHPASMGAPAMEVWREIWSTIGPMAEGVLRGAPATWSEHLLLLINRKGFFEEAYFTFSHSPIPDDAGGRGGVLVTVQETSSQVQGERRLYTLQRMAADSFQARNVEQAARLAMGALDGNPNDLPFALLYLCDTAGRHASRAAARGLREEGLSTLPPVLDLTSPRDDWPLHEVLATHRPVQVMPLPQRLLPALAGEGLPVPTRALVLPVEGETGQSPVGFLVVGLSPRLEFDDRYQGFLQLVASHLSTALAHARAYEEQKQRAEALAELDRAKTAFFSNVSHEFRTPLTLMLGPLEELLTTGRLPDEARRALELVHRNGLRLFKLVNTLLDFSRLEAGRVQASYQPTDLAVLTAGLASAFDSAMEKAGLHLRVECEPLPEPIWVDREMWEKVVLNLISNAFKFTFEGQIAVRLRWCGEHVELSVSDTGTGILSEEQSRIFERFHQVRGARGRSHEGSGIGLSLVRELVKLHGGSVRVDSTPGQGSTFTVCLPTGSAHLPRERLEAPRTRGSTGLGAAPFLDEASSWLASPPPAPTHAPTAPEAPPGRGLAPGGYILLADDNVDMRDYVRRLLETRFTVEAVADGRAALEAVRVRPPDLVLSDVMMPELDGLGLLRALRADPGTASIPIILLSARAGEEATVEGIQSGADDYLVKPFSARELLARVEGALRLARERAERERLALDRAEFEQYLIGIVSHDLRNPLAAITLTATTLLRGTELGERQRKSLGRIFASAERANRMIRDLLDFTRARLGGGLPIHPAPLDFHALGRQVVDELQVAHPDRVILLEQCGDGQAHWDGDRMAQVLTNLIGNALHYSLPGTPVQVKAHAEAETIVFEVHNEGVPIPEELLPRLFQPMQRGEKTGDNASRNVGLGLYIVDHIVRAHGGTIEVRSREGEGTTFRVCLPRTTPVSLAQEGASP
ncbi:chemotaxis protein CheY [Cystobacter fuscus]|uniref:histidine kinase n=1 Tax=Cystobacter fuscus TaxID=43 RepID=A0A250J8Z5_9BACT|nr:GAF domain-containing sensor histidine kinase [Cystobacter fuscus]ATB40375.1 chemotaxis protein CheY [Cystobacter fuscus]